MQYYLDDGLVIQRDNNIYEFVKNTGSLYQFESTQTGEIVSFTEPEFFSEWRIQKIIPIPVKNGKNETFIDNSDYSAYEPTITDLTEIVKKEGIENALKREQYIKKLKFLNISRGCIYLIEDEIPRIAEEINDKHPPATSTLIKWWRKYEKNNNDILSLIDKRHLIKSRKRLTDNHELFILDIIDVKYMRLEPDTALQMYGEYTSTLNNFNLLQQLNGAKPERAISERSFYRRIGKLNKYDVAVAQLGKQEANRRYKMMSGHLPSNFPLEYVEIDHTPLDIFVLDDKLFIPLGRPWLTIIKDRYSGVIIGLFITFAPTGTDSIFGALKHSLQPHDKVHEKWPDIENEMPWGQAFSYVTDRGKDFLSLRYRMAIRQLGADYEYCAVRSPWLKGAVERAYRSFNYLIETLPGKTFPRLEQRKDYDPAKQAVIRFSSFIYIVYKWACDIHNVTPHRIKNTRPIDLWNEGLTTMPKLIPTIPTEIDTLFGAPHESTLRHDGIIFKYLNYGNSFRLKKIYKQYANGVRDKYRAGGPGQGIKIKYRVNYSDLGYIMVLDPRDETFFRVNCLDQEYSAGLSLLQHKQIRKEAKLTLANKLSIQDLYKARENISDTIRKELEARTNSKKTQYARYFNINSDNVLEGIPATILPPPTNNDISTLNSQENDIKNTKPNKVSEIIIPIYGWGVQ